MASGLDSQNVHGVTTGVLDIWVYICLKTNQLGRMNWATNWAATYYKISCPRKGGRGVIREGGGGLMERRGDGA